MTDQLRSLIRDALDETAEVQRRALYHRYHDSQYARAARRLRWYDWLLIAVPTAAALVLLAGYAGAQEPALRRIRWEQPSGAHPIQRVYVGGIELQGVAISQVASSPLTYATAPLPIVEPVSIDVEVCLADGTTCARGVLPDGRPGPLRLYDGCRLDASDNGAIDLPDLGRLLTSFGTCG